MTYEGISEIDHETFVQQSLLLRAAVEARKPTDCSSCRGTAWDIYERKLTFLGITLSTHQAVQSGATRVPLPPAARNARLKDLEEIIRRKYNELLSMSNAWGVKLPRTLFPQFHG